MPAPGSMDRQTFLTFLRQSGLVSEPQLAELEVRHREVARGRTLARMLVQQGILTRFQAERLLMGRTAGFFLGQYRILEQIGRGGMGRVYKAQHLTMQRTVALKVLSPDLLNTERAVDLFLHEVRAVAQLQHPNVVAAYDASAANGRYYLVLEYVDGPNLDQLVRHQGPLTVGLACDYLRQAANGLQCAHLLKMLHRDLKPANILVQWHGLTGENSPGLVKVSDFGLARLAAPTSNYHGLNQAPGTIFTRDNTVMGTPDYLSPEQSRSLHKTDIRSDLYSLGCTFYFLLTGSVPYPGGTALEKLIRHSTERPEPISTYRSDVPAAVVAILNRLMARHPDDRFQTPAELADALQPYAVGGPTPWACARAAEGLDVAASLLADPEPAGKESGPGDQSNDELTALTPTLTHDLSPTPGPPSSTRLPRRLPAEEKDDLQLAVLSALLVVSGLFVLAVLIALLSR